MINPYNNVYDLFTAFGICKRGAKYWRLTEATPGCISGLEKTTHGILLATNGILCLIERNGDKQLFEGHMDFFVPLKVDQRTVKAKDSDDLVYEVGKADREAKQKLKAQNLVNLLTAAGL